MAGAPTKYDVKYERQVYRLCLLGATDIEIADFLSICEKTLNNWKHEYPEFLQSIKKGKAQADAEVAHKLFKRATGYQHKDVDIKMFDGHIIKTDLIKHYPPDTTAAIFWLKNRKPKDWRDKTEIDQTITGQIGIHITDKDAKLGG